MVILRSENLAASVPGYIELDEDILLVVEDNIVVVVTDNNGDRVVLGLGNGLGSNTTLDLAGRIVFDKLCNSLLGYLFLLVKREVLALNVLDGEGGQLVGIKVQHTGVHSDAARGIKLTLS